MGEPVAWVQYYMGVTNKFLSVSEYHQAKEEPHQEHYAYVPLYTAPPSIDALISEIDILPTTDMRADDWLRFSDVQEVLANFRSKP